jgi:hypothetical protein
VEPVNQASPVSEPVPQPPSESLPVPNAVVPSVPVIESTPIVTPVPEPVVEAQPAAPSSDSVVAQPPLPEISLPTPQEVGSAVVEEAKDLGLPESTPTLPEVIAPVVDETAEKANDIVASLPNLASNMNFLETEVGFGNFTSSKCTSTCVRQCVGKTKDKAAAINCLTDCGCYEEFSSIEMMQAPEARLIGHSGGVSLFGYFILTIFLTGVILFTGYLVIERDEKKEVKSLDEESSQTLLYQRLE